MALVLVVVVVVETIAIAVIGNSISSKVTVNLR